MKPLEALRALGTGGEAPAEAKQRVYATLAASAAAGAAQVVAPADGALGASRAAAVVPSPAPFVGGLSGAKALAVAAGIWVIGGATGAALYGALRPREVQVVYVDRPVLAISSASSSPSGIPASASVSSAPLGPNSDTSAKRVATAAPGAPSELSRERALLDLARAHAARGEPALSLQQAERHRAQFPRGKLAEEREALAIRALLALGRNAEARTRAQDFHSAHPDSFLLPAIDSALSAP